MDNGAGSYRRFLQGDEHAFDEILLTYRTGLTFFIGRIVGDADAAEDIAIDVFTDLIVHRHRYNFKTTFKTYLYMMGRSRALDYLRHRRKLTMIPLDEVEGVLQADGLPEAQLLADERRRALSAALDRLPVEQREAVHLVYMEDLSYEQAAKVMRKTRKQIDNLLTRAKKRLRELLGEEAKCLL